MLFFIFINTILLTFYLHREQRIKDLLECFIIILFNVFIGTGMDPGFMNSFDYYY